jgi:hypothetical protein
VQQREKQAVVIGDKNAAIESISSGGSLAKGENSRALGLR